MPYTILRWGDFLEIIPQVKDQSINAIITDLPYGSTNCRWDSVISFEFIWKHSIRILKPRGCFITTASQPFLSFLIQSNLEWFKYCWYWKKEKGTGFALSGKRPLNIIEEIAVFYDKGTVYNPQRNKLEKPYRRVLPNVGSESGGKNSLSSMNSIERVYKTYEYDTPHTLLEFGRERGNRGVHPTQKPVALYEYLVKTYTNENDWVLDFCMGSGTTGVAAKKNNRNFVGIEKEENYFNIAKERIENANTHS